MVKVATGAGGGNNNIRTVTLGGEPVHECDVQMARDIFPKCRVCVIYAAGELGIVFKSTNYHGAFYQSDLDQKWERFSVDSDELVLIPGNKAGSVVRTGDLAAIKADGSVQVTGRMGRIANIGGHKVLLDRVERVIENIDGVELVRCSAIPNPITGQIIQCNWQGFATEDQIREICVQELPKHAVPRIFDFGKITLNNNGKKNL